MTSTTLDSSLSANAVSDGSFPAEGSTAGSQLNPLTFPLHGSRLIEASAGTGKTFTLALLYVRLVLGQGTAETKFNRPLTPKEILVVTFTEAAADELRDRIRQRLVEAAGLFSRLAKLEKQQLEEELANLADDPLGQIIASYPQEEFISCAWQLDLAAQSMDEARISTIHSWCNRVLVEQAFATRGLFNRQIITQEDELLSQVVTDYWRKHFYQLTPEEAQVISQAFNSPAALKSSLVKLLQPTNQGVSYQGEALEVASLTTHLQAALVYQAALEKEAEAKAAAKERQQQLAAKVKQAWVTDWPLIEEHLLELRTSLHSSSHKSRSEESYKELLAEIYAWAKNDQPAPTLLKNFAAGSFRFLRNGPFSQENPMHAFKLLKDYFAKPEQQGDPAVEPSPNLKAAILAQALPWVRQEFYQRKQQQAEMGFNDLLVELNTALSPDHAPEFAPQLAANLRTAFPVAMIDEFQDTDPIQYQIFNRIYNLEANSRDSGLFMIGDPKQAIYSFRGADIYTYLQARAATQGRHYTLKKNFRSTQGVVAACNTLFNLAEKRAAGAGAFKFKTDSSNPLPFVEVEAQGKEEQLYLPSEISQNSKPAKPLTFWYFQPEDDADLALSVTHYREQAAQSTASQLVAWLTAAQEGKAGFGTNNQIDTPLKPEDIAILVRSATEAKIMRQALQERQLASVYMSDKETIFTSQEAADILHWLVAVAAPFNEGLVKAALATSSLQLPLEVLASWQEDELAWEQQMETFQQLHQLWQTQGVLVMLHKLLTVYQLAGKLMQLPNGERSLTNILHLAEWLQEASQELDGQQAMIRHLEDKLQETDSQQLLRLESDAKRIKIITIHKSKGLEYPLVLLPFISAWRKVDGRTKQVSYRLNNASYEEVAGNSNFAKAWQLADEDRLKEDLRLLYVALTRASHALWLGVGALKIGNAKKPQVENSALGYLLNNAQPFATASEFEQTLKELTAADANIKGNLTLEDAPAITAEVYIGNETTQLEDALETPKLTNLTNWWIASYSAIEFTADAFIDLEKQQVTTSPDRDTATSKDEQREEEAKLAELSSLKEEQATELSTIEPSTLEPSTLEPLGELSAANVLHYFPAGAVWGTLLHSLLEWAADQEFTTSQGEHLHGFAAVVAENTASQQEFYNFCQRRQLEVYAPHLWGWLVNFVQQEWQLPQLNTQFALASLQPSQFKVELEFMLESHKVSTLKLDAAVRQHTLNQVSRPQAKSNQLNGLLKGFIDLIVEHQGRYYVVDWKSNRLGAHPADYTPAAMQEQILAHRYDMQYVLYLVALHRLLKARLPNYNYDQHIGGAIYVFLRGMHGKQQAGLFCDKPPAELIEQLSDLLAGKKDKKDV